MVFSDRINESNGGAATSSNDHTSEEEREQWGNRTQFLFAAIGSAIGVGNILRFPVLVYRHGGLAFLVPYLLSLFLLGIPLLKLETGMGQLLQCGFVKGTAKVDKRSYGIGIMGTIVAGLVAWYYSVLMSWSWVYLVNSFRHPLPWDGGFVDAKLYFHKNVLNRNNSLYDGFGECYYPIVLGLMATWTCVYFSIWKGVKSMGMVLYVTIPLPFVLLFFLFMRGVTLPGAGEGLKFYMGRWDWTAYEDGSIYVEATSQIFFSLSLAQGIMQAYSSNNPRDSKYISNAWIIGIANSSASIFAGFALFSTLGFLSRETKVPIERLAQPGFDLGFITYPTAIAMFGPGWSQLFAILFFATLLMLGIDSAFSLVEVLMSPLVDIYPKCKENRSVVALILCLGFFLLSLVFATRGGFWALEIVDHYVISYSVLAVGILECILMMSSYGLKRFDKELKNWSDQGNGPVWFHSIWWFVPVILSMLLIYNFILEIIGKRPSAVETQPAWAVGIVGWILCVVLPFSVLPLGFIRPWRSSYLEKDESGSGNGNSLASADSLATSQDHSSAPDEKKKLNTLRSLEMTTI